MKTVILFLVALVVLMVLTVCFAAGSDDDYDEW